MLFFIMKMAKKLISTKPDKSKLNELSQMNENKISFNW